MAWLAILPARPDELQLDLHGYRYHSGERVIRAKIAEAQANGYRALRIIHGGSTGGYDAFAPNEGTLKAALLTVCKDRAIVRLLDGEPFIGDSATTLLLRANRHPSRPTRWSPLPRPEYKQDRAAPPGAAVPGEMPLFTPPPER